MKNNNLQRYLNETKKNIDINLNEFFDIRLKRAKELNINYYDLVKQTAKVTTQGGKRLRPALAIIGYHVAGGKEIKKMIKAAVALEIFHNFLLIHDDIMDKDDMRHGDKNVSGVYFDKLQKKLSSDDARHVATCFSILAGDMNCGFTYEAILGAGFNDDVTLSAVARLNDAIFEVGAGQYLDVLGTYSETLNLDQIEAINLHKTADYSVVMPLQYGAILANGSDVLARQFAKYGKCAGVAFQISDDILGVFGTTDNAGKPIGSDISESKQTMLMHFGLELASDAHKKILQSKLGKKNITNQDIEAVRSILTDCGAKSKAESIAQSLADEACVQVNKISANSDSKELLIEFANYCVSRIV